MPNKFDINSELVKLADLLDETGLSEIEFESTGRRIRVALDGWCRPRHYSGVAGAAAATPASPATSDAESSAEQGEERHNVADGGDDIPVARTGENFIQVGDTISEGETVMLIEAMKTYNPVRATKSGRSCKSRQD